MNLARVFCRRFATARTSLCAATTATTANGTNHENMTASGSETVSKEEKAKKAEDVVSQVVRQYDVMSDAMSLGIQHCWKDYFIKKLQPTNDTNLLDVASGTGDIAFRFMDYSPRGSREVTVCDANGKMIRYGKRKAKRLGKTEGIKWVKGDATDLPFEDNSFDAYTISFGIRNVSDLNKALQEAHRVLRPGGRFLCMEFSQVANPLVDSFIHWWNFEVLPVFSEVLTRHREPYEDLREKIVHLPNQEAFTYHIKEAGFTHAGYENVTFGVVAIHTAFK
ncbi:2-methoxy-6-polyprenyl-1,4-benzoquinol methylase, mitochondrial-like [Dysidea avara]|uniref:2-methoxy-6-polyprenyl-1,4-benzoquinol methylase, mitochondrial-like n=1 Tax=Dysidea avara TaxID=196820 RepID=UPI003330D6F2